MYSGVRPTRREGLNRCSGSRLHKPFQFFEINQPLLRSMGHREVVIQPFHFVSLEKRSEKIKKGLVAGFCFPVPRSLALPHTAKFVVTGGKKKPARFFLFFSKTKKDVR
jgi:hypothetical protein